MSSACLLPWNSKTLLFVLKIYFYKLLRQVQMPLRIALREDIPYDLIEYLGSFQAFRKVNFIYRIFSMLIKT